MHNSGDSNLLDDPEGLQADTGGEEKKEILF